jgi:hypothetical protein
MSVMVDANFIENNEANVFKIGIELDEIIIFEGFMGLSEKDID